MYFRIQIANLPQAFDAISNSDSASETLLMDLWTYGNCLSKILGGSSLTRYQKITLGEELLYSRTHPTHKYALYIYRPK